MTFEMHKYEDRYEILMDGDIIYAEEGRRSWPNEDAIDSILDEANFGQPQRSALKAVFGLIETVDHRDGDNS